jgi:hypothetical protein
MTSFKKLLSLMALLGGTLLPSLHADGSNPYKAPMYWDAYEYPFTTQQNNYAYIPEDEWQANIDWVNDNLKEYGYNMICIDGWGDEWDRSTYNGNGYRSKHSKNWVHDYAYWSGYLKDRGMTLGIYYNPLWVNKDAGNFGGAVITGTATNINTLTNDSEGGLFHWVQVDNTGAEAYVRGYVDYYANMGVSYLRVDFLSWYETGQDRNAGRVGSGHSRDQYEKALFWMRDECDKKGMYLSLVMPSLNNEAQLENKYGHMYRINEDVDKGGWDRFSDLARGERGSIWSQWQNAFDGFIYWSRYSGRGQVRLDGDFMRLNTMANDDERRSMVSLNAIAGGPIAIADSHFTGANHVWLYQNKEVIKNLVDDKFVGKPLDNDPSTPNKWNPRTQIWTGQMTTGDWIVGLFNREGSAQTRTINYATDLGLSGAAPTRDLWAHADLGDRSSFSASIPAHGVVMLRISNAVSPSSTPSPVQSRTVTPSATRTSTPAATFSSTATASSTPASSPTRTASPSRTISPTATFTATASPSVSPSPVLSPTPTSTVTLTSSPGSSTSTPVLSSTPSVTATRSQTPPATASPTASPCASETASPVDTESPTASATEAATAMPTGTMTATATASRTAAGTATSTATPAATATPQATATRTPTPAGSPTSTGSPTKTPVSTATWTSTPLPNTPPNWKATPAPGLDGPLIVDAVVPAPNPHWGGPLEIRVHTRGGADYLTLRLFSRALHAARIFTVPGNPNALWQSASLPADALDGLASGVYYVQVVVKKSGKSSEPGIGKLMLLR